MAEKKSSGDVVSLPKEVSIIGLGKMGGAIARMLADHCDVYGYDVEPAKFPKKINVVGSLDELLSVKRDTILAVKPAQIASVISRIRDDRTLVSVAAGISIQAMDGHRSSPGPTIRVMPNTPLMVHRGMSVLYANDLASEADRERILSVFKVGGEAFYLSQEKHMHTVTALSGSGPAFVELFMQAMEDSGVLLGMSRDEARELVLQTVLGTAAMVKKSGRSPQDHIHDVTSPGGTTMAGLSVLKDFGLERCMMRAVKAAAQKSEELGS